MFWLLFANPLEQDITVALNKFTKKQRGRIVHHKKLAQRRAEMQRTEFSTKCRIYPTNIQNRFFFIISIVLFGKKYTKMIGYVPWQ